MAFVLPHTGKVLWRRDIMQGGLVREQEEKNKILCEKERGVRKGTRRRQEKREFGRCLCVREIEVKRMGGRVRERERKRGENKLC